MTDEQLSALLRIKRFEQPPPQYFDRLLQDVHRRQRSELLRRPLWKIAAERVQTFFSEHSMGNLSYAGALASVLVVGVSTIGVMTSGGGTPKSGATVAVAKPPAITASTDKLISIQNFKSRPLLDQTSPSDQLAYPVSHEMRYIIDARPAMYEPTPTVNF